MTARTVWILLPGLGAAALLSLGLLAGQPPRPPEGPVPPVVIAAGAPAGLAVGLLPADGPPADFLPLPAQVTGRAVIADGGYQHQWPAFHARARFEGPGIAILLDDPANRYRVTLDGARIQLTRTGRGLVVLTGLGPGPHDIRLEKLSERAEIGWFGGFYLPPGARPLPPPPPAPLIEFIGDSDTVGYGDTAPGRDCSAEAQFLTTDSSRAYGPMTARAIGADYRMIAVSGIRLVAEPGSVFPGMIHAYPAGLPLYPDRPRAPEQPADAIVIAIGSNDFGGAEDPAQVGARLSTALLDFMRARRAEAPGARIVLLTFGEYGSNLVGAHQRARDAFIAGGDRADLIVLPELARTGCHWHPSLNDHQLMAGRLVDLLAPDPRFSPR